MICLVVIIQIFDFFYRMLIRAFYQNYLRFLPSLNRFRLIW